MKSWELTPAGKMAIRKAQAMPIVQRLNSIVKDADNDISYASIKDGRSCHIVSISELDNSRMYAPMLIAANICGLQKSYNLPVYSDIEYGVIPEDACFILNNNNQELGKDASMVIYFRIDANPDTPEISAILQDVDKLINDYPLQEDAEEQFFEWEYQIKSDYIYGDFVSDFEKEFHWPLEWYNLKHPGASNADFINWLKEDAIISELADNLNITAEGNLDFADNNIRPYACELAKIARGNILQLKSEKINAWRKNWMVLPGLTV